MKGSAQDDEAVLDTVSHDKQEAGSDGFQGFDDDDVQPPATPASTWKGCETDNEDDAEPPHTPQRRDIQVVIYTPSKTWIPAEESANSQMLPDIEDSRPETGNDDVPMEIVWGVDGNDDATPKRGRGWPRKDQGSTVTQQIKETAGQSPTTPKSRGRPSLNRHVSMALDDNIKQDGTEVIPVATERNSAASPEKQSTTLVETGDLHPVTPTNKSFTTLHYNPVLGKKVSVVRDKKGKFAPKVLSSASGSARSKSVDAVEPDPVTPPNGRLTTVHKYTTSGKTVSVVRDAKGKFAPKDLSSAIVSFKSRHSSDSCYKTYTALTRDGTLRPPRTTPASAPAKRRASVGSFSRSESAGSTPRTLVGNSKGKFASKNGSSASQPATRRALFGSSTSSQAARFLVRDEKGKFTSTNRAPENAPVNRRVSMSSSTSFQPGRSLVRDEKGKFTSNNGTPALVKRQTSLGSTSEHCIVRGSTGSSASMARRETPIPPPEPLATRLARRRASMSAVSDQQLSPNQDSDTNTGPALESNTLPAPSLVTAPTQESPPPVLVRDSEGKFTSPSKKETPVPLPKPLAAKRRASMSTILYEHSITFEGMHTQKSKPASAPQPSVIALNQEGVPPALITPSNGELVSKAESAPQRRHILERTEGSIPVDVEEDQGSPSRKPASKPTKRKRAPAKSPYFPSPPISPELARKSPRKKGEGATPIEPRTPEKNNGEVPSPQTTGKKRTPGKTVSCIPFPPLSSPHFGLIQEKLADNPFRLLIAVTFLIRTHGKHAIPVFFELMGKYPTPEALLKADTDDIVAIIRHLGLQNQRAAMYQTYAQLWLDDPPVKGKRYAVRGYPNPTSGRNVKSGEILADDDKRDAWEIGHMTQGPYAIDSWRIFCRDKLRGEAEGFNGEGRGEAFQPEWMRVVPADKELRAYLRWMWLKEGFEWDPFTGEKEVARPELMRAAMEGRIAWDDEGGVRMLDQTISASASPTKSATNVGKSQNLTPSLQSSVDDEDDDHEDELEEDEELT